MLIEGKVKDDSTYGAATTPATLYMDWYEHTNEE
jgi:hypothetical protein